MASLLEGEKQLFEKFWRGTFKAVAMPRPESVIIASIAARRAVTKLETTVCLAPKTSEVKQEPEEPAVKTTERKRHVKRRGHKRPRRRHEHSVSSEADISPWTTAKRKKKRKNSKRKRGRERSRSSSPSPLRKKKKKKRKTKCSKRRKQHRSASKKTQHRSRSDSHHKHRSRRADNRSPGRRFHNSQSRTGDHDKPRPSNGPLGDHRRLDWGAADKLASNTAYRCCALRSECSVRCLHPGREVLNKTAIVQDSLSSQGKGHADYDSGNDTSSPPSTKTGITRAKVEGGRKVMCRELASPEKLRFTNRDNASDSGTSLTSYDSACELVQAQTNLPRSGLCSIKREEHPSCTSFRTLQPPVARQPAARSRTPSHRGSESRSRSRTRSSRSSWYRNSYSRSRSRSLSSSHRSYCRSSSCSLDSRRGSVCSVSSGRSEKQSRHVAVRGRERRTGSSSYRKQSRQDRKRSRRRFSSPMRKRRRGSPSHLEARRITSARKRPIPYYRPSPSSSSSSSSRCSSLATWSLFSISHTRSSYRSHSHASSWNSAYSSRSRSRSRSYDSLASYNRARR